MPLNYALIYSTICHGEIKSGNNQAELKGVLEGKINNPLQQEVTIYATYVIFKKVAKLRSLHT